MKEGYFRSSQHATWIDEIILNKFLAIMARDGQMNLRKCLECILLH
jgi:hypothetical protein